MDEKCKFFFENMKNAGEFFEGLETTCKGLIYISETDAAVTPFVGEPTDTMSANNILQQTGKPLDEPIEEIDLNEFFGRLTSMRDWYGEPEKARAKKFLELKTLLEVNLRQLKVFKTGTIQRDIYIVGIDSNGCLMGVKTNAVET